MCDKNSKFILDENSQQTRNIEGYFNLTRGIYENLQPTSFSKDGNP